MRRFLGWSVLLFVVASSLEAAENWGSARVVPWGRDGVVVKAKDGGTLATFEVTPKGKGLASKLRVTPMADGLDVDLRTAFAAGAKRVGLLSETLDAVSMRDQDMDFAAMLTGTASNDFPAVEVVGAGKGKSGYISLRAPTNKIITERKVPVGPGRRAYPLTAIVPEDADDLRLRLDFTKPGNGTFRYHGVTATRVVDRPKTADVAAEPKLLLHLPFDGSLKAAVAGGRDRPLLTNAPLTFVAGRKGQALRFDRASASRLVYSSKGNVNPERGTMTCWLLHDLPVTEAHTLFSMSAGRDSGAGDGSLTVLWNAYRDGGILRWQRGDFSKSARMLGPQACPFPTNGWVQMTVAWNPKGVTLYANGEQLPRARISDNTCPLNDILFLPPEMQFAEGWQERISLLMIGCGGNRSWCWKGALDDVRIWSEPFTPERARRFYEAESGVTVDTRRPNERPLWKEPWDGTGTLPPNQALCLPTATPGVPAHTELVEEVSPVDLARGNVTNRFRATGKWMVGTCEGVPYLEAGEGRNDRFAVRFQLDGSVPLWCFEITYPDDKARAIDLVIQNCRKGDGYSMNNGIETGLEHPLTGKNATKKFLFWRNDFFGDPAKDGDLALVAMTQDAGCPAAISRIRVHAIRDGRIPATAMVDAAPVNGRKRRSAIWFEDPAIRQDFGTGHRTSPEADLLLIDRIAAYMKYTGQDTLIYPAVWYAGVIGDVYQPRRHMSHFMREVCRRFERDGLSFVPSVNQQWFPQLPLNLTRRSLTDGSLHATPISILETGLPNLGGWHHSPTYYNISHPDVQNALLEEIDLVCEECRDHANFLGVAFDPFNAINVTSWGTIGAGYNDYSVAAFEKATGIRVPVDRQDPRRGRAYARWLLANAREAWIQWRCDVLTDFYRRATERVRRHRADLQLFLRCSIIWRTKLETRPDLFDGDFCNRILRESGIDTAALAKIPGMALSNCSMPAYWHDELHAFKAPKATLERIRDLPETEGYLKLVKDSEYPVADFHESYYETSVGSAKLSGHHSGDGRLSGDWLSEKAWRVTHFAASGREALRPYAKSLKHADFFAFGRGGFLLGTSGDEAVTAPWMRAFRALPAVTFADVPGFAHDEVRVRRATVQGQTWFYAVNTGFTPVALALPLPAGTVDAVTGEPVAGAVTLDSYEIRSFVQR